MRRLGAIETIFLCPFILAQRALCAAAILARAAALIVRRTRLAPVLFIPLSALIAVSNALTCCATLSRSALNCASMSICESPPVGHCSRAGQSLAHFDCIQCSPFSRKPESRLQPVASDEGNRQGVMVGVLVLAILQGLAQDEKARSCRFSECGFSASQTRCLQGHTVVR